MKFSKHAYKLRVCICFYSNMDGRVDPTREKNPLRLFQIYFIYARVDTLKLSPFPPVNFAIYYLYYNLYVIFYSAGITRISRVKEKTEIEIESTGILQCSRRRNADAAEQTIIIYTSIRTSFRIYKKRAAYTSRDVAFLSRFCYFIICNSNEKNIENSLLRVSRRTQLNVVGGSLRVSLRVPIHAAHCSTRDYEFSGNSDEAVRFTYMMLRFFFVYDFFFKQEEMCIDYCNFSTKFLVGIFFCRGNSGRDHFSMSKIRLRFYQKFVNVFLWHYTEHGTLHYI